MPSFAELRRSSRRLAILQLLQESPECEAGQHLLYMALPGRGLASSADEVAGDLAWLEEQGLVTTRAIGEIKIGRLTRRGYDVARGLAHAPGVERPGP